MIELINVGKTYVSEKKQRVCALRGVNVRFGDRGLVVVLGKSGSGKSTLLNLLGGLDSATEGEIVVDGVSMKKFKKADYDGYRNGYVGFVFQEYNLLPDFNVKDNVELTLRLSSAEDATAKAAEALRKVELDESYLTRRVNELSGGEKQRVAIARSLAKDSRLILADEPTGNLDSATGESIWRILKSLSESRLVVVVTHDGESASKYADRIVKIADGAVVEDSGETVCEPAAAPSFSSRKRNLPFVYCVKMGINNLLRRPLKAIGLVVLSLFCTVSLILMQICLCFSFPRSVALFVTENDIPFIRINQLVKSTRTSAVLKPRTLDFISEHTNYIVDGVVRGKQDVLDFGFTFDGEPMELDDNSFYAVDVWLRGQVDRGSVFTVSDGEYVRVSPDTDIRSLVGERVAADSSLFPTPTDTPILAGIVDSSTINTLVSDQLPNKFVTENFCEYQRRYGDLTLNRNCTDVALRLGDSQLFVEECTLGRVSDLKIWPNVLTPDGSLVAEADMQLADDEIVITYEMFAAMFDAAKKFEYVDRDSYEVFIVPEQLGKTFRFCVLDAYSDDVVADLGEFRLAGIRFDKLKYSDQPNAYMNFSQNTMVELHKKLRIDAQVFVDVSSVKDLGGFLDTLQNKFYGDIVYAGHYDRTDGTTDDCVGTLRNFEDVITTFIYVFAAVGALMLVVQLLLVVSLVSADITDREKTIGILSALGVSSGDVFRIFLSEVFIIAVICFVLVLGAGFLCAFGINSYYNADIVQTIRFVRVDVLTFVLEAVMNLLLMPLVALIPLRKTEKIDPIQAIRRG